MTFSGHDDSIINIVMGIIIIIIINDTGKITQFAHHFNHHSDKADP